MTIEFDASSGTFLHERDAWSAQFGSGARSFDYGLRAVGFLIMSPGTVTHGDAAGNVTLPGFAMAFRDRLCPPRSPTTDRAQPPRRPAVSAS